MDNRKHKLNESSRSSLLKEIEFSICSDIRDMVKLRNDISLSVFKEDYTNFVSTPSTPN